MIFISNCCIHIHLITESQPRQNAVRQSSEYQNKSWFNDHKQFHINLKLGHSKFTTKRPKISFYQSTSHILQQQNYNNIFLIHYTKTSNINRAVFQSHNCTLWQCSFYSKRICVCFIFQLHSFFFIPISSLFVYKFHLFIFMFCCCCLLPPIRFPLKLLYTFFNCLFKHMQTLWSVHKIVHKM